MKIVITGAAGFIGSNLAKHFAAQGHEVLAIDCFRGTKTFANGNLKSFGHFKNLVGFNGQIYCGDLRENATIWAIRHFAPQAIFHQAAVSDTTAGEQDEVMSANLNTFGALLDVADEFGAPLIYASSAAVYGNEPAPQAIGRENPQNVYGFSKLMMDTTAAIWRAKKPALRTVGLRYFNVYGEGEFYKNTTASMVLQFGLQMLRGGVARLFRGSERIWRDFVYIGDVVRANEAALGWESGVYNVGTGVARSFLEVAEIVRRELGLDGGMGAGAGANSNLAGGAGGAGGANSNLASAGGKCETGAASGECAGVAGAGATGASENGASGAARFEWIENPFTRQYQFHTCAALNGFEPKFSLEEGIARYAPEIRRIFEENFC